MEPATVCQREPIQTDLDRRAKNTRKWICSSTVTGGAVAPDSTPDDKYDLEKWKISTVAGDRLQYFMQLHAALLHKSLRTYVSSVQRCVSSTALRNNGLAQKWPQVRNNEQRKTCAETLALIYLFYCRPKDYLKTPKQKHPTHSSPVGGSKAP